MSNPSAHAFEPFSPVRRMPRPAQSRRREQHEVLLAAGREQLDSEQVRELFERFQESEFSRLRTRRLPAGDPRHLEFFRRLDIDLVENGSLDVLRVLRGCDAAALASARVYLTFLKKAGVDVPGRGTLRQMRIHRTTSRLVVADAECEHGVLARYARQLTGSTLRGDTVYVLINVARDILEASAGVAPTPEACRRYGAAHPGRRYEVRKFERFLEQGELEVG